MQRDSAARGDGRERQVVGEEKGGRGPVPDICDDTGVFAFTCRRGTHCPLIDPRKTAPRGRTTRLPPVARDRGERGGAVCTVPVW